MDLVPISHQQNKSENSLQRNLLIQSSALFNNDEKDMTSLDWLKIYGVKAQKLDYFSILQSVATQHCDGITTPNKNSTVSRIFLHFYSIMCFKNIIIDTNMYLNNKHVL